MKVYEFRHIHDLNDFLGNFGNQKDFQKLKNPKDFSVIENYVQNKLTIIPLSKTFENPSNKMLVNTITYVVIEND